MAMASRPVEIPGEFWTGASFPARMSLYPQLRYMGNKYRLLPWIYEVVSKLEFSTALDAFSGSGCVSYLFKTMGKAVTSNDFLRFASELSKSTIENSSVRLDDATCERLVKENPKRRTFIEDTFAGIFYTPEDLRFLDTVWSNLDDVGERERALVLAALIRSCIKRQPRGVFTVSDPERYKDGRRDVCISLRQHFGESVEVYNKVVFDNGRKNEAAFGDIFDHPSTNYDLVYMDPPYVPRSDDNCYIKRYHFLEGLASYWQDPAAKIMTETKVKKLEKRHTPFSYRREAADAFDRLFCKFANSTLVLSYSSNGFPDLDVLVQLMRKYKNDVTVKQRQHRYNFGTHENVGEDRKVVQEYLCVSR